MTPFLGSSHQKDPIFLEPTPNDPLFSTTSYTECPYFCSPVGTCTLAHFHIQVLGVGVKNTLNFYSLSSCESKASASFKSFSIFLSFIFFFQKQHETASYSKIQIQCHQEDFRFPQSCTLVDG